MHKEIIKKHRENRQLETQIKQAVSRVKDMEM